MQYEATFIFDKDNKNMAKKLTDYIETVGASIAKKDNWGVKSLAYPIAKRTEATYLHLIVEADSDQIKKLEQKIQLEEELLRHLIVKVD
ncbi:30S ribosomal protein S6 [Candidatus Beckwithbacteria bacterium]|nr:30S ribosomal protein S6 [Candidatus Beckwithbacteria bacterium]